MTRDERLLKRALDVLDWAHDVFGLEKDGIAIKTALRERLAQQEQGPVSGVVLDEHGSAALVKNGSEEWHCKKHNARRLYTTPPLGIYYTPPQRKPLTDEQIDALVIDKDGLPNSHLEFARAIEAAHGIKEKNT